jgi:PAS domain S-box-containing protein
MTLRARTGLSVGLLLLACSALVFAMGYLLISSGIGRTAADAAQAARTARQDQATRATEAALRVIAADTAGLAERVAGWARRDDTYAYVESRSATWRRANLPDSLCPELGLSVIAMVNRDGRVVDRLSYDLDRKTFGDLPAGVAAALAPGQPLADLTGPLASRSGLLVLPGGLMLAAASAIVPRATLGSPRGVFFVGRFLTPGQVALIAGRAGASVEIFPLSGAELPADVREAAASGSATAAMQASDGSYAGYAVIRDVSGSPAAMARVRVPVDLGAEPSAALAAIERQASAASLWLAAVVIGAALIALGGVLLIQETALFRRVGALAARLEELAAGSAPGNRVVVARDDEIGRLETAVNESLAAVESAGRQVSEREKSASASLERCRLALAATGQLAFEVDLQASRVSLEGAVGRVTGHSVEEARSMPLSVWEAMLHPEDRQAATTAAEQAAASGTPYRIDYRLQRKDGSWITVEERGARIPGAEARVAGTIRAMAPRHASEAGSQPPAHGGSPA